MAKSKTKVEETTVETVEETVATTKEIKVEQSKNRTIIANSPVPFRTITSLESKYVIGTMPVGVAYEIVKEANSRIYGDFYKLNNGYYITKSGNYSIN